MGYLTGAPRDWGERIANLSNATGVTGKSRRLLGLHGHFHPNVNQTIVRTWKNCFAGQDASMVVEVYKWSVDLAR